MVIWDWWPRKHFNTFVNIVIFYLKTSKTSYIKMAENVESVNSNSFYNENK